ncbi:MAG TPA: DNA methyltransferase, partial [Candidatus Limnocylindrales bacterium]
PYHGKFIPQLVEVLLDRYFTRGAHVLDPFAGSGTTLIAADQLGRRCYAMEIDPRYAQVTIERWQAFTGQAAVKIDG